MIQLHPDCIRPHSETAALPAGHSKRPAAPGTSPAAGVSNPFEPASAAGPFGAGLSAVLQERLRQIEQFGHTPEADSALPMVQFQIVLTRLTHFLKSPGALADPKAHRRLVQLAAFTLATIDRLDAEKGV